ncbi:Rieske 2Fe-2S domain-containing protein [Paracoccus aestuariivivens]|nr:Rieske 2Fe-2S domain-containing protein [Paracoccus aestuariivivens]
MNWTPAALSQDIPSGSAAPGQLGDKDIVIWRSASGRIAAWSDRCPHRGMRLSHGFVRGEFLSCIYHGWRYGDGGQCHRIPAHPELTPPEAIKVPVFAVVESGGIVWVAEKDAEPADLPMEFAGFASFRTIRTTVPASIVAAAFGCTGLELRGTLGGTDVVLLLQPLTDGCNLHVLAADGTGPDQLDRVSVAVEALRRQAESVQEFAA